MVSLTNAQKHELIVKFNEERDALYGNYQNEKTMRKDEEVKSGTMKNKLTGEYAKLNKQLGSQNRNKDVRRQLQDEVDMYTDN